MTILDFSAAAIISQLTGFLFLENVKMEKQRTNASYRTIVPKFLNVSKFWNGFWPYGGLQAFTKGLIFGYNHHIIRPWMKSFDLSQTQVNMMVGVTTGVSEALLTSPLMHARVQVNREVTESVAYSFRMPAFQTLFQGSQVLMAKRMVDWTTRLVVIDEVKKVSPISSSAVNTFIGAGLTSFISSPIDRLLPIVYSNQRVIDVFKSQKWAFLYKGFTFRALSTAQYTTCLLVLPEYFSKFRGQNK